jgi:pSer/pThr/pTyr-binding forkhead associated (FHA) protein
MSALLLTLLKLIFVALLFLFPWQIARTITIHLGVKERSSRRRSAKEIVIVRSDSQSGLEIPIDSVVVMGRSEQADVILDDSYASEFHLRFSLDNGNLFVQDLGSTNGTYVNGRRITAPVTVTRGDAVQVGKSVMEVR